MSYSTDDDGKPTGITFSYQLLDGEAVRITSPDRSDRASRFDPSIQRLQLSNFLGGLSSGLIHEALVAAESSAFRGHGWEATRWNLPPLKFDVVDVRLDGGTCRIGFVNLGEDEIQQVVRAVERIDGRPDVVLQTSEEQWKNFEAAKARDRHRRNLFDV